MWIIHEYECLQAIWPTCYGERGTYRNQPFVTDDELHVAANNEDRHFSKLFNVEETKGIIHSRIYPARDVVHPVWYNISALIRYNFIIKNYVNRKITSYIYLLISTISFWLHVKYFIALTKRESVRRIYFVITGQDYIFVNTSTSDHEKQEKVRQHWRQKRVKPVYT